jgi:hypothetical protein
VLTDTFLLFFKDQVTNMFLSCLDAIVIVAAALAIVVNVAVDFIYFLTYPDVGTQKTSI